MNILIVTSYPCTILQLNTDLVLGSVPYEPLRVGEGHIAGGRPVPLVIRDNLHLERFAFNNVLN